MTVGGVDRVAGGPDPIDGSATATRLSDRSVIRGYRHVGDRQMHLRRGGESGPSVVLLHHAPSSSAVWAPLMSRLVAAGLRVTAPDLPGFGASDPPDARPDLAWYADQIAELLATEGLLASIVVGRQTGAAVATALAARRPELVRALVLWGYPLFGEAVRGRLATETTEPLDRNLSGLRLWLRDLCGHDRLVREDDYVRAAIADFLAAGPNQHWAHNAVGLADLELLLTQVRQPITSCYDANRADLTAQVSAARHVTEIVPSARFVDIPGLASCMEPDAVELFAGVIETITLGPSTRDSTEETDVL